VVTPAARKTQAHQPYDEERLDEDASEYDVDKPPYLCIRAIVRHRCFTSTFFRQFRRPESEQTKSSKAGCIAFMVS
jgi:hypothetical protein